MLKIGLFYASSTGNTEDAAKEIQNTMGNNVELNNVADVTNDAMKNYSHIIFGISTWGEGDLQDDWEDYMENINNSNLSGKIVAMFGLGDQKEYCDYYLNAMGTIYDKIVESGATVVGSWNTDGYDFDESTAIRDGKFVGLALDEDNQDNMTTDRIKTWVQLINPYFVK